MLIRTGVIEGRNLPYVLNTPAYIAVNEMKINDNFQHIRGKMVSCICNIKQEQNINYIFRKNNT